MTARQRYDILKPIVDYYNELFNENIIVECSKLSDSVEITAPTGRFSGPLISKIAFLAEVYTWSFGIYSPQSRMRNDEGQIYILI